MNRTVRIILALAALFACGFFLFAGCSWNAGLTPPPQESGAPETSAEPEPAAEPETTAAPETTPEPVASADPQQRTDDNLEIIREMIYCYNGNGERGDARIGELLSELRTKDPDAAGRWERIMDIWRSEGEDLPVHEDVLPDGLADTDELCIVALGFQLNPDGSIQQELLGRLKVVLASAQKYPRSLIVCTGGGTAAWNREATEAGEMAKWLVENGVAPERIVVEDKSLSTAQNAMNTYEILTGQYPQVRQIAVISSNYHVPTGVMLFKAVAILRAEEPGQERLTVVSNAAFHAGYGNIPRSFQAGELIELAGDTETAYRMYGKT